MKLRTALICVAASAMVLSPVGAMANTRSGDASVSLAPIAADAGRLASPVADAESIKGEIPAWLIALLLALGIALYEQSTSKGIFD